MSHPQFERFRLSFSMGLQTTWLDLKKLSLAIVLLSLVVMPGCQGLGLRSRNDDMAFLNEEEDDWSVPIRSPGKVPRPSFADVRSRENNSGTKGLPKESRYAAAERNNKRNPQTFLGYPTAEGKANKDRNDGPLLSTQQQDIDFEGALDSLPPAQRELYKKQLDAVQQHVIDMASSLAANSEEQPSKSSNEKRTLSDSTENPSESNENAVVKVASESNDKKKTGVSIRLNDSGVKDSGVNHSGVNEPAILAATTTPSPLQGNPAAPEEGLDSAATISPIMPLESKVVSASGIAVAPSNPNAVATSGDSAPTTPQNSSPVHSLTLAESANHAIEQLEKQVRETPSTDESIRRIQEIKLRMLYVIQRRLDDALRPIEHLSDNENAFIAHEMQALFEATNPDAMPVRSRHWSLVMNNQREATNYLAAASNLEIKSLAFCTEVERYGVVTKFPKSQFQADQEVLLYCEIENVTAEKIRNGYETQLQGSYEIIDGQGRKVADQLLPMEPELCQNHRRDYFIVYKIYMPQQIASGSYQLRLTIEDMKAHKWGQSQLDFQIKK
ncbi:MAG: hypothetical protein NTU79_20335 [Planctomycetota bacterium]|nr:hypothetical protein [Planctomycetota bacterium]